MKTGTKMAIGAIGTAAIAAAVAVSSKPRPEWVEKCEAGRCHFERSSDSTREQFTPATRKAYEHAMATDAGWRPKRR